MLSYKKTNDLPLDRIHILTEFTQEQINEANDNVENCIKFHSDYSFSNDTFFVANQILTYLNTYMQQGADVTLFPQDFMRPIFYGLTDRYIALNQNREHDNTLMPLIYFFASFSNFSDNTCYSCRALDFANVLTKIYMNISDTHILYEVEKILFHLINNKPKTSSCFDLNEIYQRTCKIYNTVNDISNDLFTFTMTDEPPIIQNHRCITRALELNTSILIILGKDVYKLGNNPVDYMKTSIELMIRGDRFCENQELFSYQLKFLLSQMRLIFQKTPFCIWHKLTTEEIMESIIDKLSFSPEIELLTLETLECIAESCHYCAYFILSEMKFVTFTPSTMEAATWYCRILASSLNMLFYTELCCEFPKFTIINNFTSSFSDILNTKNYNNNVNISNIDYSSIDYSSIDQNNINCNKNINYNNNNSNSFMSQIDGPFCHFIQIAKSLEGCGNYIVQKSMLLALAALFNLQNEAIIEEILSEFPDFVNGIVNIIDDHDPKDVLHIVNTLRMIKAFVDKKEKGDASKYLSVTRRALEDFDNLNIIERCLDECGEVCSDNKVQAEENICLITDLLKKLKNVE